MIKKFAMALLCFAVNATDAVCSAAPGDKPEVARELKELEKLSRQPCPTASCYLKQAKEANAPFSVDRMFKTESGRSVHVVIREHACKSEECKPTHSGMWGTDGDTPRFVTDSLKVTIDNASFLIPEKFYKDITNIKSVSVSVEDDSVTLSLTGGEAAGYFRARYILGGGCGFERQICGEVCEHIWERTIWHNSFIYGKQPSCVSSTG